MGEYLPGCGRLKGGKPENPVRVSLNDELYGAIAEVADAIEEQNWVVFHVWKTLKAEREFTQGIKDSSS